MGMVVAFHRLTTDELTRLLADPNEVVEQLLKFNDEPDDEGRHVDVDKSWHALHVLLNGHPSDVTSPGGAAIFGGQPFGEDLGYGPARLLNAVMVAQVSAGLAAVSDAELTNRYDPARMTAWDIYPRIWDEPSVLTEYLLPNLSALRSLYTTASAANEHVLVIPS